jgi:hypothetical protein
VPGKWEEAHQGANAATTYITANEQVISTKKVKTKITPIQLKR